MIKALVRWVDQWITNLPTKRQKKHWRQRLGK